jgi:hypothetical protein
MTGCAIEHIGNYGVEVNVGCADIANARNYITDIGAGGIRIGHFFSWETDGSGRLTERAFIPAVRRPLASVTTWSMTSHDGTTAGGASIWMKAATTSLSTTISFFSARTVPYLRTTVRMNSICSEGGINRTGTARAHRSARSARSGRRAARLLFCCVPRRLEIACGRSGRPF